MPNSKDRGAVTAELVLALPTIALVMVIAIATMGVQIDRLKMVSTASQLVRAISREEPQSLVDELVATLDSQVSFELTEFDATVCVELSREYSIPGLEVEPLKLSEKQCAGALKR
ncbi:MAG: hypothetical protein ACKOXT_01435 [Actinomycetota bacterium]